MSKNNVEIIIKTDSCSGCGACVNICPTDAIKYTYSEDGFLNSVISYDKCIKCGKCYSVCPIVHKDTNLPLESFAAMGINEEVRFQSSSGGLFGVFARGVLMSNGVVYGCTMTSDFQVKHIRVDHIQDLKLIIRSKYVQSYMGVAYKQILEDLKNDKLVLFSGTPCQVSAVKNFIPDKYKDNLFLIDIVCHGVPSQMLFNDYIEYLQSSVGEIKKYEFRAKRSIENGMNCFFAYTLKKNNKKVFRNWPEDIYNYLYMKSYIYRDCCYNCNYASLDRPGDITLCDYWHWDEYHSKDFSAGDTVSGMLVNTEKGLNLITKFMSEIQLVPTVLDNLSRYNGCLVSPSEKPQDRENVLAYWKKYGFSGLDKKFKRINKASILKYRIMRHVPQNIITKISHK